jgi:hypothetical protein
MMGAMAAGTAREMRVEVMLEAMVICSPLL